MIKRNPVIEINDNIKVQTIGDVHLGRSFKTGVPSSKLGVRETSILKDFENLLFSPEEGTTHVVMMGDLFDKFVVHPNIVMSVYKIFKKIDSLDSGVSYILLPGNHDFSRDKTKSSSYSLLYFMCKDFNNLTILHDSSIVDQVDGDVCFYYDCYNPFHKEEEYHSIISDIEGDLTSFGHWDSFEIGFGSYFPQEDVVEKSSKIISGHIHTPSVNKKDEIEYIYTGSLQPYSHAEDPLKEFYISIKYDELESILNEEPGIDRFKNKNVRIICYPGYVLETSLDCLSLTYMNSLVKNEDSSIESFDVNDLTDFSTLYIHELKETHDISDKLLLKINEYLKDTSTDVPFSLN